MLTVWLTIELVLVTKLESPPYSAVMLFEPTVSDAIDKVAVPDVKVPVPMIVEPFLKVTVPPGGVPEATELIFPLLSKLMFPPVGVPEEPVTVAVKVTDSPKTEGFAEDANAVVVLALLTTWLTTELVLVMKLPSPE